MSRVPGLSWPAIAAFVCVLVGGRIAGEQLGAGSWVGYTVNVVGVLLLWLVVLAFSRGDPPRRAWLLLALGTSSVLVGRVVDSVGGDELVLGRYGLLIIANVLGPFAQVLMLRLVRGSDLVERARGGRILVLGLTAVVAIVIATASVFEAFSALGAGPSAIAIGRALTMSASAIGDGIGAVMGVWIFVLLVRSAGGALARPYLLLGTSSLIFLVLDLLAILGGHDSYGGLGVVSTGLSALAWALGASAALSQFLLLRERGRV